MQKRSFIFGAVVTLVVLAILEGGSFLVLRLKARKPPIVTAIPQLDAVMEADQELLWSLESNLEDREFDAGVKPAGTKYRVNTNELGLRNPPIAAKGSRFRILAIGDSCTFGLGVEDDETWPARLQAILDRDATRVEVINAGCPGFTSFQGFRYLVTHGLDLDPDLVIATFGLNDVTPSPFRDLDLASAKPRDPLAALAGLAFKNAGTAQDAAHPQRGRVSPGEYLDTLLKIRDVCDANGIGLLYVSWPIAFHLTSPESERASYRPVIAAAARMTATPLVDLFDAFRDAPEPVHLDGTHANAVGCRIVAERLAAHITGRCDLNINATPGPETNSGGLQPS